MEEINEDELGLKPDEIKDIEESVEAEGLGDDESGAKIVGAGTEGFGYNYTSLADLAKNGVKIPKMKVAVIEGSEYLLYRDGKEWQQGARIVVPEIKGMNAAQAYGSALTYARRYTVMLAESVVSDDDQNLEKKAPSGAQKESDRPASEKALGYLENLLRRLEVDQKSFNESMARAKASASECSKFIDIAKKKLGE